MSYRKLLITLACSSSLGLLSAFASAAKAADFTLDFDRNANGDLIDVTQDLGISVGDWKDIESTEIDVQWFSDFGVTISAFEKPSYDENTGHYDSSGLTEAPYGAVLFNTDPNYYQTGTSGRKSNGDFENRFDTDLLTGTNQITGEEYLTVGGDAKELGNVLIIQERKNLKKIDDEADGGVLAFDFNELVELTHIDLLDVDDFGSRGKQIVFTAYDELGDRLNTWQFDQATLDDGTAQQISDDPGDNSLYRFNFEQGGVKRLEVLYPGSGAIAELRWQESQPPASIPEPASAVGLLAIASLGLRLKKNGNNTVNP